MIRRSLLVFSVLVLFLAGRACWWEPSSLIVQEVELRLPWPAPASPRIAVLSDLHVGSPFNGRPIVPSAFGQRFAAGRDGDQDLTAVN